MCVSIHLTPFSVLSFFGTICIKAALKPVAVMFPDLWLTHLSLSAYVYRSRKFQKKKTNKIYVSTMETGGFLQDLSICVD